MRKGEKKSVSGAAPISSELAETYLGFLIIGAANRITTSATAHFLKQSDMTTAARRILLIGERPDLNAAEIGAAADLDKAATSRALKELQTLGMLVIEQTKSRGRAARVKFLPLGHKMHTKVRQETEWRETQLLQSLSKAEKKQLRELLTEVIREVPKIKGLPAAGKRKI